MLFTPLPRAEQIQPVEPNTPGHVGWHELYAANGQGIKLDVSVFDIDMSLCCYCNLCTYPCPTDCIYMTPEYEFASTDLTQHLYHFAKPNAKFLTVNPKPPAPKPPTPAPPAPSAPPAPPAPEGAPPVGA